MAAHSALMIGATGAIVDSSREGYATTLVALFSDEETVDQEVYKSTAVRIRERLALLGYTSSDATAVVNSKWATRHYQEDASDTTSAEDLIADYVANIGKPHADRWMPMNESAWRLQGQWGYIWGESRKSLKFLVDRLPDDEPVTLDLSEVINLPGMAKSPTLCADARASELDEAKGNLPTIVLTEGSTDTEFLNAAVELLRPDLVGFLTFMNFATKAPGGTDFVVKGLRSFAGAGVANQVIGLMDNDVAGRKDLAVLANPKLPRRMKAILLPQLAIGVSYPSQSPAGIANVDINGSAVAIEMFTGIDCLTDASGALEPVEYAGAVHPIFGVQQGSLVNKRAVQDRFRAKVVAARKSGISNLADWQDMNDLLSHLVAAV